MTSHDLVLFRGNPTAAHPLEDGVGSPLGLLQSTLITGGLTGPALSGEGVSLDFKVYILVCKVLFLVVCRRVFRHKSTFGRKTTEQKTRVDKRVFFVLFVQRERMNVF